MSPTCPFVITKLWRLLGGNAILYIFHSDGDELNCSKSMFSAMMAM